jgi:hypothetical protein
MFNLFPPSEASETELESSELELDLEMEVERPETTIDMVRTRIAMLDSTLQQGSPDHDAALILVAAALTGQNIDRLARFTGLRREQVARCARRLVDNGVWREGNTVCRWIDTPEDTESFRADVAVAEGRLCRRMGTDGELEWAPQGYWRKHYEYVGPRGEEQSQVVCYHPHVEPIVQDLPYAEDEEDDDEELVPVGPPHPRQQAVPAPPASDEPAAPPVWLGGETADEPWAQEVDSPEAELFPDAVWLG